MIAGKIAYSKSDSGVCVSPVPFIITSLICIPALRNKVCKIFCALLFAV
jgi:hypothetical protein